MKKTLALIGIAVTMTLAACGSSPVDDNAPPGAITSAPAPNSGKNKTNKRGAVEVDLGQSVTVTRSDGTRLLTIDHTALSSEGCPAHSEAPGLIGKRAFSATITTYDVDAIEWLWPSDFYYVNPEGKVATNFTTTDSSPCRVASKFVGIPTNSIMDSAVTLDIPYDATIIGYKPSTAGDDVVAVEWRIKPIRPAAAPADTPTTAAAPNTPTTAPGDVTGAPASPPIGFTGEPKGDPQPLVGKVIDHCMNGPEYQRGTTAFTDGTTGWTQECAG